MYNDSESESDNNGIRRGKMGEGGQVSSNSIEVQEDQYTEKEFKQLEKRAKQQPSKQLTREQSKLKSKYETEINSFRIMLFFTILNKKF